MALRLEDREAKFLQTKLLPLGQNASAWISSLKWAPLFLKAIKWAIQLKSMRLETTFSDTLS